MAKSKKSQDVEHAGEDIQQGVQLQPLWKSIWWFLWNLGIILPQDPSIYTNPDINPDDAPWFHKDSTMFIAVLFLIARNWK